MDLTIALFWVLAFSVIVLFLGALTYILGRPSSNVALSDKKSSSDITKQQQPICPSTVSTSRRKHNRNAKKKQRQQLASVTNENSNSNNINEDKQETKLIKLGRKIEEDEEEEEESQIGSSVQLTDEEQDDNEEFYDTIKIDEVSNSSPSTSIQEQQEPICPVKQRKKNKSNQSNSKLSCPSSSNQTNSSPISPNPSKPQASVVPVKQTYSPITSSHGQSQQIPHDNNSKSNGNSFSSYNIYSYTGNSSIPPRFRQQREPPSGQNFHKRKPSLPMKKSFVQSELTAKANDFIPSTSKSQMNNNGQVDSSLQYQEENDLSNQNGYSSESDILSESPSTTHTNNNNHSSLLSTSTDSQLSLKGLDFLRSLSTSNLVLDELVSLFDKVSFSTEEVELILNKITTKQLLNRQDWQRLLSTKNDKTMERVLEDTYRSQAKILAIELQTEKNHVFELTKTNAEMDNTIRQLQQPNPNMIPYQQTIMTYQMQMRRLTDENARLAHQLHAYSMMPGTINELKQQQQILDEQLRQLQMRNSALEKEVADGERASKHAAEIYKKADAQKQERIEQMIADINRYKKIDRDLSALQQKHKELEKNSNSKLNDLLQQRDEFKKSCEQLKEKQQDYDELTVKYDELMKNRTQISNSEEIQLELIEVKAKNDLLRQRNWKIMEQLNKLSHKRQESNQIS